MNQLTKYPRMAPNTLIAQTVTVTATLVDASSTAWENATVIVQFVPGFGTPPERYTWNGAQFTKRLQFQASGNSLSVALPSNDTILPIDSMWQFIISRNPQTPAVVIFAVLDSKDGPTEDISAQFTNASEGVAPAPSSGTRVIQAPDEATALAQSAADPNNIYWWV